jgi:hypothetical protein
MISYSRSSRVCGDLPPVADRAASARWSPAECTVTVIRQSSREILMRILALAILAIAAVSAAPSARAQTYDPAYPVCLQIYQGWHDYYFECAYTSLAQCNMSASGRAAQCIVNPYYGGRKTAPAVSSRRHRRVN